jgi:hypothetical protein
VVVEADGLGVAVALDQVHEATLAGRTRAATGSSVLFAHSASAVRVKVTVREEANRPDAVCDLTYGFPKRREHGK